MHIQETINITQYLTLINIQLQKATKELNTTTILTYNSAILIALFNKVLLKMSHKGL
jgi:hypothetical protein